MSEQALDLLKLGMLVLLYLFFARVMWAVWSELRAPAAERAGTRAANPAPTERPRRPGRGARPAVLRVVEPADRAGAEFVVGAELTIGRSPACTIVVDDTYVSQRHARIWADGAEHRIQDLGSTNGTLHNGHPLVDTASLRRGDRVQIGTTVLELA